MTRAPRRDIHSLDTQITAPHPTSSPSETQLTRRDRYAAPPPAESIASDHSQHPRQHRNPNPQRPRSPPTDPPTPPISRQGSFHDETGGQETAQIPPYPQHDSPVYDYSEHERSVDFNPPSSPASPKEVVIQERRAGNQGYDEYTAVETSKHTRNGTITQITYTKGPREGHVEYLDSKFRLTDCDGNVIVSEESYNGNRGYVDEERNRDPQYADEVPSMEPRAGFFEVEERFPPATQDDNGLRPRQESSVHPLKARHRHETGSVRSEHETRSGNYGRATRRNPYTQENRGTEYDAPVALDTYPSRVANESDLQESLITASPDLIDVTNLQLIRCHHSTGNQITLATPNFQLIIVELVIRKIMNLGMFRERYRGKTALIYNKRASQKTGPEVHRGSEPRINLRNREIDHLVLRRKTSDAGTIETIELAPDL